MNLVRLTLAAALIGCAGSPPAPEKLELPAWIAQGKQAWGDEQQGFFGVGTAEPEIASLTERQSLAESRARATAMNEFEGWYVARLRRQFETSPNGKAAAAGIDEALASMPSRAEAEVKIVERWTGPDGRTFALAHLGLGFMTNAPPP